MEPEDINRLKTLGWKPPKPGTAEYDELDNLLELEKQYEMLSRYEDENIC